MCVHFGPSHWMNYANICMWKRPKVYNSKKLAHISFSKRLNGYGWKWKWIKKEARERRNNAHSGTAIEKRTTRRNVHTSTGTDTTQEKVYQKEVEFILYICYRQHLPTEKNEKSQQIMWWNSWRPIFSANLAHKLVMPTTTHCR